MLLVPSGHDEPVDFASTSVNEIEHGLYEIRYRIDHPGKYKLIITLNDVALRGKTEL